MRNIFEPCRGARLSRYVDWESVLVVCLGFSRWTLVSIELPRKCSRLEIEENISKPCQLNEVCNRGVNSSYSKWRGSHWLVSPGQVKRIWVKKKSRNSNHVLTAHYLDAFALSDISSDAAECGWKYAAGEEGAASSLAFFGLENSNQRTSQEISNKLRTLPAALTAE